MSSLSRLANTDPGIKVTVLLPALIYGPPIQAVKDVKHLNFSVNTVYNFFNGTYEEIPNTHSGIFPSYIDVRDLATAHVRALTTPEAANRRFLIGGAPLSATLIVETLAKVVPEVKDRLPKDTGKDKEVAYPRIRAEDGNEILKMKFRTIEDTIGDLARKVLELEKESKREGN